MADSKLSAKEALLIGEARAEVKRQAAAHNFSASNPSTGGPGQPAAPENTAARIQDAAGPAIRTDSAQRIALLMETAREEQERRRKKARLYGVAIPGTILIGILLWTATVLVRQLLR